MLRKLCNVKAERVGSSLLVAGVLTISTAGAQVAPAQDVMFVASTAPPCVGAFERSLVPGPGGRGVQGGATTGAPYSGVGTTTVVRSLVDGNRIVRTNTMRYARDGQGRLRTEYSLAALGPISLQESRTIITIDDPVAKKRYTLHPEMRRADVFDTQNPFGFFAADGAVAYAGSSSKPVDEANAASGASAANSGRAIVSSGLEGGVNVAQSAAVAGMPMNVMTSMRMSPECGPQGMSSKGAKPVSLGERSAGGLKVVGSRYEYEIPSGAIGNEQPITVSSEQWFSPELGVVVESTHRNPLMGDTTYKLTGISRAEPDPALFQVPGDYTVQEPMQFIEKLDAPPRPRPPQ
jgi:hypothetical protein